MLTNAIFPGYHLGTNTWLTIVMMMLTVPTLRDLTTAHAWKATLVKALTAKVVNMPFL